MKFWQLLSVAGEGRVTAAAGERVEWACYGAWRASVAGLAKRQDRAVLDASVDEGFQRAVLARVETPLYLGGDGWLRSFRLAAEPAMTVLDAAERFGGVAVEEALEKGSVRV